MNRDFKGVWIPKEIWLNEELTLLEKIIFVEIDSLDNENHCVAGNEYFATFCNCSESKVSKAIKKLKDLNMIEEISFDGRHRKIRVVKNTIESSKKYEAESQNLQSNNIDNKQENKKNNSKELLQNQEFSFGKSKTKKDSLYTKCVQLIDSYPFDNEIRNLLIEYLQFRLSIKDKPLYNNMWKGMLSKLRELTDDHGYTDDKLCKAIIKQSIERGYLSFYPIGSYSGIKSESGSRNVPRMTEEDYKKEAEHLAELEAQGVQVRF